MAGNRAAELAEVVAWLLPMDRRRAGRLHANHSRPEAPRPGAFDESAFRLDATQRLAALWDVLQARGWPIAWPGTDPDAWRDLAAAVEVDHRVGPLAIADALRAWWRRRETASALERTAGPSFRERLANMPDAERQALNERLGAQFDDFRRRVAHLDEPGFVERLLPAPKLFPAVRDVPEELVEKIAEAVAKRVGSTNEGETTIVLTCNGSASIGGGDPVKLTAQEEAVVRPFLAGNAMSLDELRGESHEPNPGRVLSDLRSKYGEKFAPAIRLPGGKGHGGYFVRVEAR